MAKLIVGEAAEAEYAAAAAFRRILDRPEWGAACDDAHRLVIVRGYPYQIIYRMAADNSTVVIAVAHCSRSPDYWAQR